MGPPEQWGPTSRPVRKITPPASSGFRPPRESVGIPPNRLGCEASLRRHQTPPGGSVKGGLAESLTLGSPKRRKRPTQTATRWTHLDGGIADLEGYAASPCGDVNARQKDGRIEVCQESGGCSRRNSESLNTREAVAVRSRRRLGLRRRPEWALSARMQRQRTHRQRLLAAFHPNHFPFVRIYPFHGGARGGLPGRIVGPRA